MMPYTKLSDEELIPIVKSSQERAYLDYKGPVNWEEWPKHEKAGLVRDMMALANADVPGYIVIGATDEGGIVRSYDGLSEAQAASFDPSKIADMIKRYADPEVSFDIYKPTVDGKIFVVIRTLPFQAVPHVCYTNYSNVLEEAAIYVRGEGARTIKVPSAEHMRHLIDRAVEKNADALVDRIRKLVTIAKPIERETRRQFESQIKELRIQLERRQ